jgi:hypothetical protein
MWPPEDWASRLYNWANLGLIVSLIAGVISTVLLVWMGNVKETYLKIQLATTGERAAHAETGNIQLRKDLETETGKVATLQKNASDAKASQQRVEIELSKQQERAANAEKELLELRERTNPRRLTVEGQKTLAAKLRAFAGQKINVVTYGGDEEIVGIAKDIMAVLSSPDGAQWSITRISGVAPIGIVGGILIQVEPKASNSVWEVATVLASALRTEGLAVVGPEVASHGHTYIGGTVSGGLTIGDNSIITMTIAKKP